jgi:hypothetical protein
MAEAKKRKDNSRKLFANREAWMRRKREGRPKQRWIESRGEWSSFVPAHWEHVA